MAAEEAQAFWVAAPHLGEIRSERLPPLSTGDVVVQALYSAISRGTEALVFGGGVPASEYQRMRAPFQVGEFPGPVKYGYASVGQVESGPNALRGRTVFVLYPHQTRYIVPAGAVHLVPDNVPADRAVLAANLETAVNGVWDAGLHIGDRVSVVGGGTVGCLAAWLAGRVPGCRVELVDVNPEREAIARALGIAYAPPDRASEDVDVVIHASGSPQGLASALRIAAFEATIVEMSWFGNKTVPMALGESFHSRRLVLKSSQVGAVASSQRARWDAKRRMTLALSLLADPALDALITGESPFEELPAVMKRVAASPSRTLCHRITYAGASDV